MTLWRRLGRAASLGELNAAPGSGLKSPPCLLGKGAVACGISLHQLQNPWPWAETCPSLSQHPNSGKTCRTGDTLELRVLPNLSSLSASTSSLPGRRDLGRDGIFPSLSAGCLPDRRSNFSTEIMKWLMLAMGWGRFTAAVLKVSAFPLFLS